MIDVIISTIYPLHETIASRHSVMDRNLVLPNWHAAQLQRNMIYLEYSIKLIRIKGFPSGLEEK